MAAPCLRHNRGSLFSLWSTRSDSKARFLSVLKTCLAEVKNSQKRDYTAAVSTRSGDVKESIDIPNKITRSPTTILEALSKTVRGGTNKPLYQNVDDPALLSRSDGLMRHHLAALDNGRKAAQAMIAMNPEYYTHFWDEPLPETCNIVLTGYNYEDPCEEALLERIGRRKVTESIEVYKAIKLQGGEISQQTLERFLDLLTVFNHQDPDSESGISHYINPQFDMDAPFPASTWQSESLAEEVFYSLPEKTSKAYCSLICGLAENYEIGKAFELYREARAAKVSVDVFTYNCLISIVSLGLESMKDIKREIKFLMSEMVANDVTPNVETFNAALKNCRRVSRWRGSKQYALSIMSEMKACDIEPSLGTWLEILKIFYYFKDKSARTPNLFENILDSMKDKSFELKGPRDVNFFRTAMKVIFTHLPDSELALKLHDILKAHRNFDAIGNRQLRFAYFKELFLVVAPVEHTDTVMEIYDSVVPYIFMPSREVFLAIFENIETFDTYHYIPQLCADIDVSNFFMEKGSVPLFHLMAQKKQEPELQHQFCDIASAFLQRWKDSQRNRLSPYLDGKVIGDMIMIFLNGGQVEQAQSALQLYRKNRKLQDTDPSELSLQTLADALIAANDFESSKDLLTLMSNLECENVPQLVSKALKTFHLSDQERNFLDGLSLNSSSSSDPSSDSASE